MAPATIAREEAPRMDDLEELARVREERFQARKARLDADTTIDPRRRYFYLDRTPWDTKRCGEELGIGSHRVSEMRGGRRETGAPARTGPHPSIFPEVATLAKVTFGVPSYGVEAGRVREWAEKRGLHVMDLETGKLVKTRVRHGRPRHDRPLMSKVQEPGKPRRTRSKKKKNDGS